MLEWRPRLIVLLAVLAALAAALGDFKPFNLNWYF